jgi:Tfp pilus assembly protein FimT
VTRDKSSHAITLIELLVVLGVVAIILGLSMPALTGYAKQMRLKAMTRQVVGLVSLARSLAITTHEDHAVVVDIEQGEVQILKVSSEETLEQRVRLPESVTVEVQVGGEPAVETRVVFRPTGSLATRTTSLILADRGRSHTITITGATGAITVD